MHAPHVLHSAQLWLDGVHKTWPSQRRQLRAGGQVAAGPSTLPHAAPHPLPDCRGCGRVQPGPGELSSIALVGPC